MATKSKALSKQSVIFRILKKFDILISFGDESYKAYNKNAALFKDMTFKSWKEAVFGNSAAEIYIYGEFNPAQNTLISNIQKSYSAKDVMAVFSKYKDHIKKKNDREMQLFPKQMLVDCLLDLEEKQELESSVSDFFKRYTESSEPDVELERLLYDLISTYNNAARSFRKLTTNQT